MPYKNKEDRAKYDTERRKEAFKYIIELKSQPCYDCAKRYPWYVMEFDHVPERGKKRRNVTTALAGNRKAVDLEIEKCDIVCANCHKVRTHNRRQKS